MSKYNYRAMMKFNNNTRRMMLGSSPITKYLDESEENQPFPLSEVMLESQENQPSPFSNFVVESEENNPFL